MSELSSRSSIDGKSVTQGRDRRLSADMELALFRIAQEALRNVERHSGASRVEVSLYFGRQKLKLRIADNGEGFVVPAMLGDLANEGKLGLLGMQERARILGGKLTLESVLGSGTEVVAEFPVSASLRTPNASGSFRQIVEAAGEHLQLPGC